jgi:hypothetical protein
VLFDQNILTVHMFSTATAVLWFGDAFERRRRPVRQELYLVADTC